MLDMSVMTNLEKLSPEMQPIGQIFHKAVTCNRPVELRIEDLPHMQMDVTVQTTLKEVLIDEKDKLLTIDADNLKLQLHSYRNAFINTNALDVDKFYFQDENFSLTFIVH